MKLNWFSPLPPARTDVAHYTSRVLPALVKHAEVTLWTDQQEWTGSISEVVSVRSYRLSQIPWAELNRADLNVYQIGNNPLFHGSIWQVSRRQPGMVVLHDFRLHHFFDGLYRVQWRDLKKYLAVMENYYGESGRRDAEESFATGARNIAYMAEHYPLTQLAIEQALAVAVHTPASLDALREKCACPLVYAPLPFPAVERNSSDARKKNSPVYRLIVFGYIGRNRRLQSVLKALSSMLEKEQFHLDVYGDILDDESELRESIRSLGLKSQVTLHGFVEEAKLDIALSQAHLAINLRYPTMGEASGSQLRIWRHALPSIVSETGWYASLSRGTVLFARMDENEVSDIQKHLRMLLSQPSLLREMGKKGRAELEHRHSPAIYADTLMQLAEAAIEFRSRAAWLRMADRAAVIMSDWLSAEALGESSGSVAKEITALAGGSVAGGD